MKNIEHFDDIYGAFKIEYQKILDAKNPQEISDAERMIWKIMQELKITLPRLYNDAVATSREKRASLLRGE